MDDSSQYAPFGLMGTKNIKPIFKLVGEKYGQHEYIVVGSIADHPTLPYVQLLEAMYPSLREKDKAYIVGSPLVLN
jgi:hypothetical protein